MTVSTKILKAVLLAICIQLPHAGMAHAQFEDVNSRAFTVCNRRDSVISRAFTVCNRRDSVISRAFTVVNCEDTDGDGVSDCSDNCPALFNPDQADCDNDGTADACAIADGTSEDLNGNGIPDECEPVCTPAPPGLIGWWRGENTANDYFGGNHGRFNNILADEPGKVGNAFRFRRDGNVEVPSFDAVNVVVFQSK